MRRMIAGAGVLLMVLCFSAAGLQAQRTLTVTRAGNGSGVVTSAPPGILCGPDCTEPYPGIGPAPRVGLVAAPAPGSRFTGWGGACGGMGPCTVTVGGAVGVTATFTLDPVLTVAVTGPGSVTSAPPGILCGPDCAERYAPGTSITLVAAPAPGAILTGWTGGGCTGTGTCTTTLNASTTITATFARPTLTVSITGAPGFVTSTPTGIACTRRSSGSTTGTCTAAFAAGTRVQLRARPDSANFDGWSGPCSGTGACGVTLNGNVSVTAPFSRPTLSVARTGEGAAAITSADASIDCGTTCSASTAVGRRVVLTASGVDPAMAVSWNGPTRNTCSEGNQCRFSMPTSDVAVTATVGRPVVTLSRGGDGTGTLRVEGTGLECGPNCTTRSAAFNRGTRIVVTPAAAAGSRFVGFTGACTGPTCDFELTRSGTVTGAFERLRQLTITVSEGGSVIVHQGGNEVMRCPTAGNTTCAAVFSPTANLQLSAVADAGFGFDGWSNDCQGTTSSCTIQMASDRRVHAAFRRGGP